MLGHEKDWAGSLNIRTYTFMIKTLNVQNCSILATEIPLSSHNTYLTCTFVHKKILHLHEKVEMVMKNYISNKLTSAAPFP